MRQRRRERRGRRRLWAPAVGWIPLGLMVGALAASAQPIPIHGRVVDADGAPLAGVRVELLPERDRLRRGLDALAGVEEVAPSRVVGSDREGHFDLTAPGPGLWKVRLLAAGRVPMLRPLHPLLEEADLGTATLLPDEGVWAFVSDAAGGPMPGARVEAWPPEDGDFWAEGWRRDRWWPARRNARTDEEGRAWLPRAAGEAVDLWALAPGFAESARVRSEGEPVRLVLEAGSGRRLRVVDHQSRPVAGAVVRVGERTWPVGSTDEAGRLELFSAPRGATPVRLDLADHWSLETSLPAPGGAVAGVEETLRLPLPLSVEGRLLDAETREPIAGALVWLAGDAREAVVSDRQGRFQMPAAPVAAAQIQLDAAAAGYLSRRWGWEPQVDDRQDLPLELFASLTLAGTVVDAAGEAVADAEVRARRVVGPLRSSWRARGVRVEHSGPGGEFRLSGLPAAGTYEVRASAAGFAPSTVKVTREESSRPLALVLLRGARLRGTVVDEEGQPVLGARVQLFEAPRAVPQAFVQRFEREADFSVSTREAGEFVIADLPPGRFDLTADAPGHAGAELPGVEPPEAGAELDLGTLVLAPGVAIEGRVSDPRGAPLEGAKIVARAVPTQLLHRGLSGGPRGDAPEAVSDSAGRFAVRDLHPGEAFSLEIRREGYLPETIRQVSAPTEEPLAVTLRPAARIFGVVVSSEGGEVPGAQVRANVSIAQKRPDGTVFSIGSRGTFARSDAEGRFSLDGLQAGEVTLEASTGGLTLDPPLRLTLRGGQQVGPVRLVLQPGVALEGRVLDPTGAPAASVFVHLARSEGTAASHQMERTGADGRFRFQGVRPGPARVRAEDPAGGWAEEALEIGDAGAWVELILESAPSISGRVVDENGEAVPFASVELATIQEQGVNGMRGGRSGPDGSFVFPRLQPGRYRLTASAQGWAATTLDELLEVTDRPLTGVLIRLSRGGVITGRISGVEPEALGRVTVQAFLDGERRGFRGEGGGRVSFDGTYRISGVTAGTWWVEATAADGRSGRGRVSIAPEQHEVILDLDLTRGITLGVAVRLNGEPVPGLAIQLRRVASEGFEPTTGLGGDSRVGYTDPRGRSSFSGLEAGSWRLDGHDPQSGLRFERRLDLRGDDEAIFDLVSARVRGRLLTSEGLPAVGSQIALSPLAVDVEGGAQPLRIVSDPQGRFQLPVVPLGPWRLQVFGAAGTLTLEIDVGGDEVELGDLVVTAAPSRSAP